MKYKDFDIDAALKKLGLERPPANQPGDAQSRDGDPNEPQRTTDEAADEPEPAHAQAPDPSEAPVTFFDADFPPPVHEPAARTPAAPGPSPSLPVQRGFFDDDEAPSTSSAIDAESLDETFAPILPALEMMTRKGLPVSYPTIHTKLGELELAAHNHAARLAEQLREATGERIYYSNVCSGRETRLLCTILNKYLAQHGQSLPKPGGNKLPLAKSALLKAGLADDPCIREWLQLKSALSEIQTLKSLIDQIRVGGRIHPTFKIGPATGRIIAEAPPIQSLPKTLRPIVRAQARNVILSADFNQIELRLVAAVIERELPAIKMALEDETIITLPRWLRAALETGRACYEQGQSPSISNNEADQLTRAYFRVLSEGPTMAPALRVGADIHLLTSLELEARKETADPNGGSSAPEAELLDVRQRGKAVNFGLAYGMSVVGLYEYGLIDFGLNWTKSEAAAARDAWFETYPEFLVWQAWITEAMRVPGSIPTESIWTIISLGDRELEARTRSQALNRAVQASASELLMQAIQNLPDLARDCLIASVHDELVFEVPADQAEVIRDQAITAMEQAGSEVLGAFDIPTEIKTVISREWGGDAVRPEEVMAEIKPVLPRLRQLIQSRRAA
jgi:DNA polymerase I-like protein with 3'-5' exonuclease and polymerase domains